MNKTILMACMLLCSLPVKAEFVDQLYYGGGIGFNDAGSAADDATGFQLFAGYQFPEKLDEFDVAIEVGYMDSGDFDTTTDVPLFGPVTVSESANGLWSTAVASYAINESFSVLGRAGLDFGDDDGLMVGIGVDYKISDRFRLRGEYVSRDSIDSLQINFIFNR